MRIKLKLEDKEKEKEKEKAMEEKKVVDDCDHYHDLKMKKIMSRLI